MASSENAAGRRAQIDLMLHSEALRGRASSRYSIAGYNEGRNPSRLVLPRPRFLQDPAGPGRIEDAT